MGMQKLEEIMKYLLEVNIARFSMKEIDVVFCLLKCSI